jgi:hypothetical protein
MTDTLTMTATYIEDELTPFSFEEATKAMRWALASELNCAEAAVPDNVLALALAKTALETGRWTKIHKFNWGNVKCSATYVGMYTCFGCDEIIKGKRIWFDPDTAYDPKDPLGLPNAKFPKPAVPPGNPQTRFRAFANMYDGVDQYVTFIHGGRYKAAWAALLTGDAHAYIHALKVAGYFTADESVYYNSVASIYNEFLGKLKKLPVHEAPRDWEALRNEARVLLFTYADLASMQKGPNLV